MKWVLIILPLTAFGQALLPGFPRENPRKDIELTIRISKASRVTQTAFLFKNDSFVPDEYRLPKEYIFSNDGGIKEIHCLDLNTNNKTLSYLFDEHYRIIGQKGHDDFITYSYNDQDKKSIENWYSYDSVLIEKTIAIYDAQNKIIRKEAYKSTGVLSRYWTYEYNDRGDLIMETYVNTPNGPGIRIDASITGTTSEFIPWPSGTTKFERTYEDTIITRRLKNNHIDKITKSYKNTDTLVIEEFEYKTLEKQFKRTSEKRETASFKIETYFSYSVHEYYYQDGILVLYKNIIDSGAVRIDRYSYQTEQDSRGNWTARTVLVNGKPISKVERRISYD